MKVQTKITQDQVQDLQSSTGIDVAAELERILGDQINKSIEDRISSEKREAIRKQREEKINTILDDEV